VRAHLFGHIDWWAEFVSRAPWTFNAFASIRPVARMLQATVGIAPGRHLPRFATETFQAWMHRHPPRSEGRRVILWSDTFTNYFYPNVGRAAVDVLERLGYYVVVPPQTCCGRPLYDFGLLESAREHLDAVFSTLVTAKALDENTPIIVLEPSCFTVFRDEAVNLRAPSPIARALAERVVLFADFVQPHLERGELAPLSARALVQVHCHQRAIAGVESTGAALRAAGLSVEILDAGCCGMAGSFGFDQAHYDVSLQAGERVLFPAVRGASHMMIVADGFSCREQIRHATGRTAFHMAEIIASQKERLRAAE
jgi:Fe-S oxidoreductase